MAKRVFIKGYVSVDGTDLSSHTSEVTMEDTADEVEVTGLSADYREFAQGLKDATITATFFQDFASSSVDAVLQPLYDAGGTFTVAVRASTASASSTNPEYSMVARLFSYAPIGGAVGDALQVEATFRNASQDGITRGTS